MSLAVVAVLCRIEVPSKTVQYNQNTLNVTATELAELTIKFVTVYQRILKDMFVSLMSFILEECFLILCNSDLEHSFEKSFSFLINKATLVNTATKSITFLSQNEYIVKPLVIAK
jgi:hypothetical protein